MKALVVVAVDETVEHRLDLPRLHLGGVGLVERLALARRDPRLASGVVGRGSGAREALHDAEIEEELLGRV